jgi:hypothetical protein
MSLFVNQVINAKGYITDSKYLWGTVEDLTVKLGYEPGRLSNGFFVAYLLRKPQINDFETAGYSITPEHRYKDPVELDKDVLKALALNAMSKIGNTGLVKVFPVIKHNSAMDPDKQYPYGKGGIPQWKLTKEIPMHVFKEIKANHKGLVYLNK